MKYIITEEQYKSLVRIKKEKRITNMILEEVEQSKKYLNESTMLNNSIVDILKKYNKKGLLTKNVVNRLTENNISKEDLIKAGLQL